MRQGGTILIPLCPAPGKTTKGARYAILRLPPEIPRRYGRGSPR